MDTKQAQALLDIEGVAERLGVGERFVRRLIEERRIPFLKVGRHVRFDPRDVEEWIDAQRVDAVRPIDHAWHRRPVRPAS